MHPLFLDVGLWEHNREYSGRICDMDLSVQNDVSATSVNLGP